MHTLVQICHLSLRDYLHERLLSACAVLGLAAVLAPLLILFGVKFGVVETLTERLRSDPATLEISPVGSGHFSAADMARWRDDGRVAFVMPRTRTLAARWSCCRSGGRPCTSPWNPPAMTFPCWRAMRCRYRPCCWTARTIPITPAACAPGAADKTPQTASTAADAF